jgi:carbon monoxide dehydrogenase subunit G
MKLEFAGAPEIAATADVVWARLMDPDFVAASAPGVESVEPADPTHFKVISGLGVGAIRVKFQLDVELSDLVPNERMHMIARGHVAGSAVEVASSVRLEPVADGRSRLNWSATSTISGPLASVGGGLVEWTARRFTEEFWTDFARRVGAV